MHAKSLQDTCYHVIACNLLHTNQELPLSGQFRCLPDDALQRILLHSQEHGTLSPYTLSVLLGHPNLRSLELSGNGDLISARFLQETCSYLLYRSKRFFFAHPLSNVQLQHILDLTDQPLIELLDLLFCHQPCNKIDSTSEASQVSNDHFATGTVSNFTRLDFSDCECIGDETLRYLANKRLLHPSAFPLTSLTLRTCKMVTDAGIRELSVFSSLMHLDISLTSVAESIGELAVHCNNLRVLNLNGCSLVKNSGVEQIAANCTSLLRLGLAECRVKDRGLRKVLTCCGQLEHLDLSWCDKITNTALTALSILPPLVKFKVRGPNDSLGDEFVTKVADSCAQLRILTIARIEQVSRKPLMRVAQQCANIFKLDVSYTQIDDTTVHAIFRHLTALVRANFSGCKLLTDDCLHVLAPDNPLRQTEATSLCGPKLKMLNFSWCNKISAPALLRLRNCRPSLVLFDYYNEKV